MRFLLDENIHHGLISVLTEWGHDVKVSPKGLANGEVFALAVSEGRALVTHDTDFAKKLFPATHPGIVVVKVPSRRFEQLKQSMRQLLEKKKSPQDFSGMLILLWENKLEEYPFSHF